MMPFNCSYRNKNVGVTACGRGGGPTPGGGKEQFHTITHTSSIPRGSGWRIQSGVEVTELSTNKQHTHSDDNIPCHPELPCLKVLGSSRVPSRTSLQEVVQ